MKPKIAVELAGYMRSFNDCYDNWCKNLLNDDRFDFDFFIHTYKEVGMPNKSKFDINVNDLFDFNFLYSRLNIKKIVIEETDRETISVKWDNTRVKLMYRKIFLCNELCKQYEVTTGTKYLYILRVRGDNYFTKKIDLPEHIDSNSIFVPSTWGFTSNINGAVKYKKNTGGFKDLNKAVCDQFAIAGSNAMDVYANTGNELGDKYIEQYIYQNLYNHNMNITRVCFDQSVYNRW